MDAQRLSHRLDRLIADLLAQRRRRLQAHGSGLQSAQGSLSKVALDVKGQIGTGPLNLDAPLSLSLNGEGLVAGGGRLDTLRASVEGSARRHQLSLQAESGASYLRASVSFYPMEAGIIPEPL